jgi:hypothetical protein
MTVHLELRQCPEIDCLALRPPPPFTMRETTIWSADCDGPPSQLEDATVCGAEAAMAKQILVPLDRSVVAEAIVLF